MTQQNATAASRRFTESELRQVLARALEVDGAGASLTADDVRGIAAEVGISAESIELAVSQFHEPDRPAAAAAVPWWRRSLRRAAIAAAGVGLALLAEFVEPGGMGPEATFLVFGATAVFVLLRALSAGSRGAPGSFQAELALLMTGFAATIAAFQGAVAVQVALMWWAVCALAGGGVVALCRALRGRPRSSRAPDV